LLCGRDLRRFVDPGWSWQRRRERQLAGESFGVGGVGRLEGPRTLELDQRSATKVDVGRGVEAEARMMVRVVVLMWVIVSRPWCGTWVMRPARRVERAARRRSSDGRPGPYARHRRA